MGYLGDITPGKLISGSFNTHQADGTPITLAGTPVLKVYKEGSTTESAAGVTLTVDYDSRTGMQYWEVDTSADGTFYAAGKNYRVVITAGTVDGVDVTGTVVATFSISNRSALRPTTADRTLDVSSGGEAGLDWANIGSPTTSVNLSGTTISSSQQVDLNTIKTQAVTCSAGVTVNANVGTTQPVNFTGTSGSALVKVDVQDFGGTAGTFSGGRPEVNTTHWDGTAVASAVVRADLRQILGTAPTEGGSGRLAGAFTTLFDVASPVLTTASVNQTGDSYTRIGSTGSGLTSLAPSSTALSTAQWTNARAGYLDALNTGVVLAAAGVDGISIEAGSPTLNMRQALSIITAFAAGVMAGVDTNSPTFKAAGASGTTRITSSVDSTGRPSVTLNPPA